MPESKLKKEIKSEDEEDKQSKNSENDTVEENTKRKKSKPMTEEKQKLLQTEKVCVQYNELLF